MAAFPEKWDAQNVANTTVVVIKNGLYIVPVMKINPYVANNIITVIIYL